jgi:hypothetical protein
VITRKMYRGIYLCTATFRRPGMRVGQSAIVPSRPATGGRLAGAPPAWVERIPPRPDLLFSSPARRVISETIYQAIPD